MTLFSRRVPVSLPIPRRHVGVSCYCIVSLPYHTIIPSHSLSPLIDSIRLLSSRARAQVSDLSTQWEERRGDEMMCTNALLIQSDLDNVCECMCMAPMCMSVLELVSRGVVGFIRLVE